MNDFDREYHVARIIAGTSLTVGGVRYRAGRPDRWARLEAAEIQRESARDAYILGMMTNVQLQEGLIEKGVWSREGQARLDLLKDDVDELKVRLYEDRDLEGPSLSHREALRVAREELAALEATKHQLDHLSVETYARSARARYLTGASLLQSDGRPYWGDRARGWERPDHVLEAAMARVAGDRLEMADLRALARSDEWASIWNTRSAGSSLFGAAAVDLDDEQRTLVSWSVAYENIASRPDAPSRRVLDDDDLLDGWMLVEKRKRDSEDLEAQYNKTVSEKVRGKDEVYMMMDPDAKAGTLRNSPQIVHSLNDDQARNQKDVKMAYLKKNGVVAEADMPDTRLSNQMAGVKITRG